MFIIALTYALVACTAACLSATTSHSAILLSFAGVTIAVLGVPHGGLDHWTGKRLLQPRCGKGWPLVFFPSYLCIGFAVAWAWSHFPVPTILGFFLLSSWHFGREACPNASPIAAISCGGLLIWTVAWVRPEEMRFLLQGTLGNFSSYSALAIVDSTRAMGCLFFPTGLLLTIRDACLPKLNRVGLCNYLAQIATILLSVMTPIVVSFTLYFCLWHSLLGLQRLRREEGLRWCPFLRSVFPLSAVALAIVVMVTLSRVDLFRAGFQQSTQMKMVFVGLASLAVPHVVVQEFASRYAAHGQTLPSPLSWKVVG
ncbi:MAG: Brp/Blh family beta-carotene 15,15'-dioxygenase [Planctomycetota bacterium]